MRAHINIETVISKKRVVETIFGVFNAAARGMLCIVYFRFLEMLNGISMIN